MPSKDICELAAIIQTNTEKYKDYLVSHDIPLPSHDASIASAPPPQLPEDIEAVRNTIIEATYELHNLTLGPVGYLLTATSEHLTVLSLQFICRHQIAQRVPHRGSVSFESLADDCHLDRDDTARFLRLAISNRVFCQPSEGVLAHNAASQALAENPLLTAWISNASEELWPSFTRLVDAINKWPGSDKPAETGYSLAHGLEGSVFDAIDKDPQKAKKFADAMAFWLASPKFSPEVLLKQFDFGSIGPGLVVEIGGSLGQISMIIAKHYPQIRCIVQDLPATIENALADVPSELKDRVTFMAHDFWTEQPVHGADVYYFRWVLHDWADKACVKILQGLVPAMKPGAKVLINDNCIPKFGTVSPYLERQVRSLDMTLKAFSNGKERDEAGWRAVFAQANSRFKFRGVTMSDGYQLSLIVAEWDTKH